MKISHPQLTMPIYLKLASDMPWPEDEKVFYLLTASGLHLGRNHRFFKSCVAIEDWPEDLAAQKPFLKISYPKIPRSLLETVVGFFDLVACRHGSEAVALLAWDEQEQKLVPIIPEQTGTVMTTARGEVYPVDLDYEVPLLPEHWVLLGDIHSHVDGPAYASGADMADEFYRPGLHIVVGRLSEEPPEIHADAVADGARFRVRDPQLILEGYQRRRISEVPSEWLAKVAAEPWSPERARRRQVRAELGWQPGDGPKTAEPDLDQPGGHGADRNKGEAA